MKAPHRAIVLVLAGLLLSIPRLCPAALPDLTKPPVIADLSHAEAMRMGERMYRDGVLPSGEQLQAVVQGDITTAGSMLTCSQCHQPSGFGSLEGTLKSPAVHGVQLYSPLSKFKGIPVQDDPRAGREGIFRPAYTDETLARALRTGVDPANRQMNPTMPVYSLNDRDAAIMVYYLRNLSVGNEPGVTETTLRFATIVTDDVPEADRQVMVGLLRHFLDNWKVTRTLERSIRADAYMQEGVSRGMRRMSLAVWELKGPVGTWPAQLEEHYRREPVFAILGSISTRDWTPIHEFCDKNRIPCIFPVTNLPVLAGTGGYTLYLNKGLYQEGTTAAQYLHGKEDLPKDVRVVQVFRNEGSGLALSQAFTKAWTGLGRPAPEDHAVGLDRKLGAAFWDSLAKKGTPTVFVLWLAVTELPSWMEQDRAPLLTIASATLLGQGMYSLPEQVRPTLHITYPYSTPSELRSYRQNIERAMAAARVTNTNPDVTYRVYPLFMVLRGPLARMRTYAYRDYFMELLEMSPDIGSQLTPFPRLSFGQGQRYASKGCYVVQLTPGPSPELVKRSEWVIP